MGTTDEGTAPEAKARFARTLTPNPSPVGEGSRADRNANALIAQRSAVLAGV
jgi:hypothetical protein